MCQSVLEEEHYPEAAGQDGEDVREAAVAGATCGCSPGADQGK